MKHYIIIALCTFLSQMCTGQVMMLFSQDSLTGIVSPLDVDSLFYWFAADVGVTDSLGGAIATDEGVGSWLDLSGRGHHVTQTTDGARPVWKATGGPGSKPTIQFDGTNDFLASAAHWWGSDDLTVFVVMKFGNATRDALEVIVARYADTSNRQWYLNGRNATGGADEYDVDMIIFSTSGTSNFKRWFSPPKSTSWILLSDVNSSDLARWVDGTPISLTSAITGSGDGSVYDYTGPFSVGAWVTNILNFQGSISEIIIYSRALTATERTAIENYLNRKYDLY